MSWHGRETVRFSQSAVTSCTASFRVRNLARLQEYKYTPWKARIIIPNTEMVFWMPFKYFTVRRDMTLFAATGERTVWHADVKAHTSTPASTSTDLDSITWDGPDDPTNPKNWSNSYKWILMSLCASMTVNMCVHPDSTIDRKGNDRTWPEHLHRRL